ncbi:Zinc finger, PHD-type [Sesbania bispinosa]|nr:Zinc finger, PHD-type [Sesbania bispinosa]
MDEVQEPAPDPQPAVENGGAVELDVDERCSKKAKVESASEAELKRVAEIVLVLSTMATMRGGRKPTDVEVELMREARTKLAHLCQGLAPKDIVAKEAIDTVIEDLGLNAKIKDQRLGFRAPKMSIAERYSHSKWKMEESKKFSAPSTPYASQPLQTSIAGTVDNRVPTHAVRMVASDKPSHAAFSSTGTVVSIPPHVAVGSSVALQYQTTNNEVRSPVVSGVMPSSHLGRNSTSLALPKVDGGSNGSPYVLQVQANSSANQPLVNAPTWSIQTQPTSLARSASENKVLTLNSAKVEVAADVTVSRAGPQITSDQSFRPFITQTAPGNLSTMHQPLQGMNMVQPPLIPSHADIAKIVQKLLLPKLPDHPTWTPPSRDYMNKALTCQMCELTVNEVDTVLLCDACEKGFHLKCLQPSVLRGIHNRVDWHCMRCLSLSGGKPLPPKYGRVMRSSNTPPKLPSNTGGIQPSSEKKEGSLDPKVSPQMLTTNGSSLPTVSSGNHNVELSSDSKTPDMKDVQGTSISSSIEIIGEKPDPNICMKSLSAAASPSTGLPGESSSQQINSEASICKETSEPETLPKLSEPAKCENLQSPQDFQVEQTVSQDNAEVSSDKQVNGSFMISNQNESHGGENLTYDIKQDESSDKQVNSSFMISNQNESHGGENLTYDIKQDDLDVAQETFVGGSGTNTEGRQHSALSSDSSHVVEWIGDVVQLVDEKKFYQSCSVDGVTYRLQGHALFPSTHGKETPSKLQSMWEDCKTGLKWVKVTKCYFPDDLPGNVGHPCISEVNEVYESNSDRIEMASSIRGPCEVLPSDKFKQENDRRCQFGIEESDFVQPIFLCSGGNRPKEKLSGKRGTSILETYCKMAIHAKSMLHLLKETLDRVEVSVPASESGPFVVVDLGCSCGNNTINVVDVIIKHIIKRYEALGCDPPEFSAFFSDLPSNDFNTLFQLLPPLGVSMEECLAANNHRSYFAAGVPGSFYRRLFPARSIHVFHSAFSLHWLSQVPESVVEKRSIAYNKGRVFIHGADESTANAYKKQFQTDLAGFLSARSVEMKNGGSMFLVCLGRTSVDPTDQGGAGLLFGTHFQDAWDDLVHEGLISSEKRDNFNIPVYAPSLQDFKEVVEANGSFAINKLEVFKGGSPLVVNQPDDATEVGRALANSCRTVCGVLVDAHIGEKLSEELFLRVEHRATAHAKETLEKLQFFHIVASLSFAK